MEKIKRLFRKILRTILIWTTISALLMTAGAIYIETVLNPPNILLGTRVQGTSDQDYDNYHVYPYTYDYTGEISIETTTIYEDAQCAVLGLWQSKLYADTFYKFVVDVEITQADGQELETGKVVINNITQWMQIIPDELFNAIDSSYANMGVQQTASIIRQPLLNDDYYTMFYDATLNTLAGIFYLPQSYFDQYPENQQHVYIMLGLGNAVNVSAKIEMSNYLGTTPEGIYTEILNEISSKLESIAATSGGLTEEQVSSAVKEAIQQIEQEQKTEFENQIESSANQIRGEINDYANAISNIYASMAGIKDALNYSGLDSIITLPEARNPLANNALLWSRTDIDLAAAWQSLPTAMRNAVRTVFSFGIVMVVVKEIIDIIRHLIGLEKDKDD